MRDAYVLKRGGQGARRLELLAAERNGHTEEFLGRLGIQKGWRCLDVGCGTGEATRLIAKRSGHCLGVDIDAGFIEEAARRSQGKGALYRLIGAHELSRAGGGFDLVYSRYLLWHLPRPKKALEQMWAALKPSGVLAIEEFDVSRHFSCPPSTAFQRYVRLYAAVARRRGADPEIGGKLVAHLGRLGARAIDARFSVEAKNNGRGKQLIPLTFEHLAPSMGQEKLARSSELASLGRSLRRLASDPRVILSVAPTFQVFARK